MSTDRKTQLLETGAKLAGKHGAINVTRRMVAQAAKVSDALVAHYLGPIAEAQKLFARHAKKMGIEQPSKEKIEAIGIKMRAHGPRKEKVVRKRSIKEVKAIKEKAKPAAAKKPVAAAKKPVAAAKKTAARKPKAPPANPLPPLTPSGADIPPLP